MRIQLIFASLILGASTSAIHAEENTRVRLMTLNVAHARARGSSQILQSNNKAVQHLHQIIDMLGREQPDIVAFQEIDLDSTWNGGFDHGQYIADNAQYSDWFGGSHHRGKALNYGTGLMSQLPLSHNQSVPFSKPFARNRKGFVVSTVTWPGTRNTQVDLVSLHLDFLSASERRKEIESLNNTLRSRNNLLVIMGDFNTVFSRKKSVIAELMLNLALHTFSPNEDGIVTYPRLNRRLDWVIASKEFEFVDHRVVTDPVSDHLALIVELKLKTHIRVPSNRSDNISSR